MELRRAGANRNSGYTVLFNKKANVSWRANPGQPTSGRLQLEVNRVSQGEQGQYNYDLLLSAEDIQALLVRLSREAALPAVAEVLRPVMRELVRLQLAAAGATLSED